ncbi:hypothetical protein ACOMHN_056789 [Nucella lapillus]
MNVLSRTQAIGKWDRFILLEENKASLANFLCEELEKNFRNEPGKELVLSGGFSDAEKDDIRDQKRMQRQQNDVKKDPSLMEELRHKFVEQCKKYFGVPYARKYWANDTPEYNSPIFLDCCGLIRQVLRDLREEFAFRIGPWNQSYMFDTLPIALQETEMKAGDLVFMSGNYVNPKTKKQRHSMLHVEVWYGEGPKTIGARWNNGKVQVFDSYQFSPKSFSDEQYHFRSIDTWLLGLCKSHCDEHPWGLISYLPDKKSIFFTQQQDLGEEDESAGDDDDDDDDVKNDVAQRETTHTQTTSEGQLSPPPPSPPPPSPPPSPSSAAESAARQGDTKGAGDTFGSQRDPDIQDFLAPGDGGSFSAQSVCRIPDLHPPDDAPSRVTPCRSADAPVGAPPRGAPADDAPGVATVDAPSVAPGDAPNIASVDALRVVLSDAPSIAPNVAPADTPNIAPGDAPSS